MEVSSAKSGESSFAKKKKGEKEKATILRRGKDSLGGSSVSVSLNSDVSSININESELAGMNSDVSVDFRKKTRKWWISWLIAVVNSCININNVDGAKQIDEGKQRPCSEGGPSWVRYWNTSQQNGLEMLLGSDENVYLVWISHRQAFDYVSESEKKLIDFEARLCKS